MFVKFIGSEECDVPALGLVVKPMQTIEVTAEQAEGLLCQEDNWKKTTATKSAPVAEDEE